MRCPGLRHHLGALQASATARLRHSRLVALACRCRTWSEQNSRDVRAVAVSTSDGNTSAMDIDVSADMERQKAALKRMKCNFCRVCGSPMAMKVPAGERELRHVCTNASCGHIEYHNPKMVVGCLVEHDGKVLLCRRAIEPCKGLWTLPAGYMELQETSADGAARETWEEANARVEIVSPYAHLDIPMIGQAYILFRARLLPPYTFSSGTETMDVRLFSPSEIPFDQLAFSSMAVTLRHWVEDCKLGRTSVHHGVIQKKAGVKAWDLTAFEYVNHFELMTVDADH